MKRITTNEKRSMNTEKWRNISRFIFLFSFFISFAGCSSDDDGFLPDPRPEAGDKIKFEIGFAPQNDGKPQTRVATAPDFTSTWENNDKIGVYIVEGTTGLQASGNWVDNLEMSYNGTTWTYTLPSGKEYYPNDDDKLSFYAYYPYDASIDPTNMTFAVKTDQSGTAYNESDLLWAKKIDVAQSSNTVSLQFTHALSLVQVEFESGGLGTNIKDLSLFGKTYEKGTRVIMKGVATTKPFSLSDASIEAATDAASDIVMTKVNGLTNTYRALVPAQTIATDKALFTVTRGDRLVYTTSETTTLTQAKAARYKVTLIAPAIDPDHVYAVGDRYPYEGLTEGIVFWLEDPVDGRHGKIVSLEEGVGADFAWSWNNDNTGATDANNGMKNMKKVKETAPYFGNYPIFEFAHGLNSCYGINTNDYTDPAAKRIWYTPAKNELQHLYCAYNGAQPKNWDSGTSGAPATDHTARAGFNGKLTAGGGTGLSNNRYWSSSETDNYNAWLVNFVGGNTNLSLKNSNFSSYRVRAVSAF